MLALCLKCCDLVGVYNRSRLVTESIAWVNLKSMVIIIKNHSQLMYRLLCTKYSCKFFTCSKLCEYSMIIVSLLHLRKVRSLCKVTQLINGRAWLESQPLNHYMYCLSGRVGWVGPGVVAAFRRVSVLSHTHVLEQLLGSFRAADFITPSVNENPGIVPWAGPRTTSS